MVLQKTGARSDGTVGRLDVVGGLKGDAAIFAGRQGTQLFLKASIEVAP
jgi:hypothetical protein